MTLTSFSFHKSLLRLSRIAGIVFILLTFSSKANAIDLSIDGLVENNQDSAQITNFVYTTLPLIKSYEENYFAYMAKTIRHKYLTFYSNKHEKLRASYASGAYLIKYTSHW